MPQQGTRKKLSSDEKQVRDEEYSLKPKEYMEKVIKPIIAYFKSLSELNKSIGALPKGAHLAFPNPEGSGHPDIPLTRKNMRSLDAKFIQKLKELKEYHRVASKKKSKRRNNAGDFKATYAPVVVGPAMLQYLGSENFGYLKPNEPASGVLSDRLELIKQGYGLRNGIHMLFYIAIFHNVMQKDEKNAQLITPSKAMRDSFGGETKALYTYNEAKQKIINETPDNTFAVIKRKNPNFTQQQFKMYSIQSITAANVYANDDLATQVAEAAQVVKSALEEKAGNDKIAQAAGKAAHDLALEQKKTKEEAEAASAVAVQAATLPLGSFLSSMLLEYQVIDGVRKAWTEFNEKAKEGKRKAIKKKAEGLPVAQK